MRIQALYNSQCNLALVITGVFGLWLGAGVKWTSLAHMIFCPCLAL